MPASPLPTLPEAVALLYSPPALPHSLCLLHTLLVPFLSSSSSPSSTAANDEPPSWDTVLAYYGSASSAQYFNLPSTPSSSCLILIRPPPAALSSSAPTKIGLAFATTSVSDRHELFALVLAHCREKLADEDIYFSGLPNGLLEDFERGVKEVKGKSLSFKVQLPLDQAISKKIAQPLDEERFELGVLTKEELPGVSLKRSRRRARRRLVDLFVRSSSGGRSSAEPARFLIDNPTSLLFISQCLKISQRSNPLSDFTPLLHLSSCIRDKTLPGSPPISWALVYYDRVLLPVFPQSPSPLIEGLFSPSFSPVSVAAMQTLPTHRRLSLASHTIQNLARHLATAFSSLPESLRPKDGSGSSWIHADWDDGNPMGQGFFRGEGWDLLEEGVRWARGII